MSDLVSRLRALARSEHDDLSIGAEAADEIEALRQRLEIDPVAPHLDGIECRDETIRGQDKLIDELRAELAALKAKEVEHEESFDLRWKADVRAIKRWRAESPGCELRRPDHVDLVIWLIGQLDTLESERDALRADAERYRWIRDHVKTGAFADPDGAVLPAGMFRKVWVLPDLIARTASGTVRSIDDAVDVAREETPV